MSHVKVAPSTREKILETGLQLFSTKGYLGATTKEIALKAGVAEVTVFRHFNSKEALFEEVISTYSFLPRLKELLSDIKQIPYEKALTMIAGRFLETLELRKDLIRIMHSEIHRYPHKIHVIYNSLIDGLIKTLSAYFRERQERGELASFDSESGARAFLGMFFSHFNAQEFLLQKRYAKIDDEKTIREFVKIFINGTLKKE
jgi:AcrR family transcriptional regulator